MNEFYLFLKWNLLFALRPRNKTDKNIVVLNSDLIWLHNGKKEILKNWLIFIRQRKKWISDKNIFLENGANKGVKKLFWILVFLVQLKLWLINPNFFGFIFHFILKIILSYSYLFYIICLLSAFIFCFYFNLFKEKIFN